MLHDGGLGRAVRVDRGRASRHVVRVVSGQGGGEHEGSAVFVLAHDLMGDVGGAVRAVEVDRDGFAPYLLAGVLVVAGDVDAGVEEREVDRAEPVDETLFEVLHLLGVGDVAWFGDDVRAEQRVHLGGEFLHLVLFGGQVDQGHVRSGLGQRRGRVASQPAGGSGDESLPAFHGELVGERVSGVLPPVDPQGIVEMRELILKLNREKQITVLISSHILDELSRLATHYGIIDNGRMVKELSAEELDTVCRKCVCMEVTDTSTLARVLDSMNLEYKIISATTADVFAKINVTQLTVVLAKENCEVLSMQEKDESLESYYISLVGGDNNA